MGKNNKRMIKVSKSNKREKTYIAMAFIVNTPIAKLLLVKPEKIK